VIMIQRIAIIILLFYTNYVYPHSLPTAYKSSKLVAYYMLIEALTTQNIISVWKNITIWIMMMPNSLANATVLSRTYFHMSLVRSKSIFPTHVLFSAMVCKNVFQDVIIVASTITCSQLWNYAKKVAMKWTMEIGFHWIYFLVCAC